MKAEGEKRGVKEESRKTGKWQGCGTSDDAPAVPSTSPRAATGD